MILAYTGRPGAGKTLSALEDYILTCLKAGRHVFTNITGLCSIRIAQYLKTTTPNIRRLLHDWSKMDWNTDSLDVLLSELSKYKEAVLVLDECHIWLGPDMNAKLRQVKIFFSLHRKGAFDIVLITQHIDDIWKPLMVRIEETHVFERGKKGFRTQYTEYIFFGSNITANPVNTVSRYDNKKLYTVYASREEGTTERLNYLSIWANKKLIFYVGFSFFGMIVVLYLFLTKGLFGWASNEPSTQLVDAPRMEAGKNVVYVRYVSCDLTTCRGVQPDGSIIVLPIDYDSGKYPFTVRRVPRAKNTGIGSVIGGK